MFGRSEQIVSRYGKSVLAASSVVALIFFGAIAARAQYRFDQWTADDGLPQNSDFSILQTGDGRDSIASIANN